MLKIKPLSLLVSMAILLLASCRTGSSEYDRMVAFGEKYTAAWNSKIPANMASFYAEDGSLVVNKGAPSVGREQLAATSGSYMDAFPDMKLKMDSLVADGDTYR